jgi:nucleoid-associated protein EbfC
MADLMGMMQKVKELQGKMQQLQAELETLEVVGTSGGGLVSVTLSAKGAMKKLVVDPSLMKPGEKEIVEDLVVAAHADARGKAERLVEEKAKALTGGLPLPPGMKLF